MEPVFKVNPYVHGFVHSAHVQTQPLILLIAIYKTTTTELIPQPP
jgi:hypothetical protein